jgi:hypothetical protein
VKNQWSGRLRLQCRRKLKVANILLRRITRKTDFISHEGLEIAAGTHFKKGVAHGRSRHDLPFAATESVPTCGGNEPRPEAGGPTRVELVNERALEVSVAHLV